MPTNKKTGRKPRSKTQLKIQAATATTSDVDPTIAKHLAAMGDQDEPKDASTETETPDAEPLPAPAETLDLIARWKPHHLHPQSSATKAEWVRQYCAQAVGGPERLRHAFNSLIYTRGVRDVAEALSAYWLIDLMASHQEPMGRTHGDKAAFQVWRLEFNETHNVFVASAWSDTPGSEGAIRLTYQEFGYTDFPRELMPFEWFVCHQPAPHPPCAMLKEEY